MELPCSYLKKEPTVDEALSLGFVNTRVICSVDINMKIQQQTAIDLLSIYLLLIYYLGAFATKHETMISGVTKLECALLEQHLPARLL